MEYARIRKEDTKMNLTLEELWEMGLRRDLTQEDLERLGLARKGKWQYTVADIRALPEWIRVELIDGEIFVRTTTPATIHQDILMGLFFQMAIYIRKKKGKCKVVIRPFGVILKNDIHNFVEPDIMLICDENKLENDGCYGAPDFVIEIVSPSYRKLDYENKLTLYRESGVREYWIVDPEYEQVTVYHWEQSEQPALYPFSERIKVGVYDDLYLDIVNRHGTLQEVLVEEHQEGMQEGIQQGIQQGLAALVTSLKAVLPDLDAVCQAVNRNEIYKDIDREEIARYYDSDLS